MFTSGRYEVFFIDVNTSSVSYSTSGGTAL